MRLNTFATLVIITLDLNQFLEIGFHKSFKEGHTGGVL